MSDFIINNSSISCIDLKINGLLWPNDYSSSVENGFLRFNTVDGLSWQPSQSLINNADDQTVPSFGNNYYLIMSSSIGSESTQLAPYTNNYLRAGLGSQTGGSDNCGTGITYTPKGQITIGLKEEDTNISQNSYGSTMTSHYSLTYKEISIIDTKENIRDPIPGGAEYNKSLFTSSKVDVNGLKLRENGNWVSSHRFTENLYNKVITNPNISGNLIFPMNDTNTSIGSNSGNHYSYKKNNEINGTFRSNKNLSFDLELKDGYYNH